MKEDEKTGEIFYDIGFNLGNDEDPEFQEIPALYNHYDIMIKCVICQFVLTGCSSFIVVSRAWLEFLILDI